jgi:hypothetical protein
LVLLAKLDVSVILTTMERVVEDNDYDGLQAISGPRTSTQWPHQRQAYYGADKAPVPAPAPAPSQGSPQLSTPQQIPGVASPENYPAQQHPWTGQYNLTNSPTMYGYAPSMMGEKPPTGKRVCGMRRSTFFLLLSNVVLVIILIVMTVTEGVLLSKNSNATW